MKKTMMFLGLLLPFAVMAKDLPSQDNFMIKLNKVVEGQCDKALLGTQLNMSYDYDFKRNMGMAKLDGVNETRLDIPLYPLGVSSEYDFMSDMAPKAVKINGKDEVLYRIIFGLQYSGKKSAAVMFGEDGNCILASNNY